ncbi:MAG TPA: nucleotide pyrophosphatase/phosphodiesterase family protein [Trebonia sp.]|nr:nucleotide pyrophosphatase/phosphodiesterase family protein [Trebonia sp.]
MTLAREPRTSPIVPSYGESSLADLSASILASLTGDAAANVLNLPETGRVCLLVIDGLGLELLRGHQAAAPFLAELAFNARPLTAGFPSTTVTSMGSLGTGLTPGIHGMLGYQVAIPGQERLLNGLHWPDDVDPVAWQPHPTIYEKAAAAGIDAVHVAHGHFAGSGLTRATLRGADYRPANYLGAVAALTADALAASERVFVSAYHGDLDATGHRYGASSPAWVNQLAHVDKLAEQVAANLPYGAVLYVTADHGMVNVGPDDRIDADADGSPLRDGVALLGGEPRCRHVYARPGAADEVLATWREVLGEHAWVMSREEAIKDGLFGTPVSNAMAARIGDVVAACVGTRGVVATKAEPFESSLIGMHGSLTSAEQLVPMLTPAVVLTPASAPDQPGTRHQPPPVVTVSRPGYPRTTVF